MVLPKLSGSRCREWAWIWVAHGMSKVHELRHKAGEEGATAISKIVTKAAASATQKPTNISIRYKCLVH